MQDRRTFVRMVSEAVGISIGTVDTILIEDLKLYKVCARFEPKILSDDQKQFVWNVPPGQCPMPQINAGDHLDGRKEMKTVQHPSYSPDLAPCNFFLFPRMKGSLRRIRFQSTEELKKASKNYLIRLLKKDFEEVFQNWKRCMKNCVDAGGNYFEGDKVL